MTISGRPVPSRLLRAYRATNYWIEPGGPHPGAPDILLRIGRPSIALQTMVVKFQAPGAALITAWNPGSRLRPVAANLAAGRRLAQELGPSVAWLAPYRAVANAGDWPDEPGLAVIGPALSSMRHLARRYAQNAIVWQPVTGSARLVLTRRFNG